jgi:AhpD family alkylhydroperoxidase
MTNFKVPTREEVSPEAQAIFDNFITNTGKVPNIYAFAGQSANALSSYLAFQKAQANGSFNIQEREAIFLAVSQENGCQYCLAAHTMIAQKNGFSEEETIKLRLGTIEDPKLNVLAQLSKSITATKGKPAPALVEKFFEAGYNQTSLVDLVALVINISFTNYIHNITNIPVDFPAAPSLEQVNA